MEVNTSPERRNHGVRWTIKEMNYLETHYRNGSLTSIATHRGLRMAGTPPRQTWTAEDWQCLEKHLHLSLPELQQLIHNHILERLRSLTQYEPVIGIMGKTGAGKSSLCNALFQGEITPVSNVESCTRDVLRFRLRNGSHSLMMVDLPSVGESEQRDDEYTTLYRRILPELDLVLWVIKADDRALSVDEHFYRKVMLAYQHRVLFVVNQADKAEPCHQWSITGNLPSPDQQLTIEAKRLAVQRLFLPHHPVTTHIGGGTSNDWAMRASHRHGSWLIEPPESAMKAITRNIDRSIWRDLMKKSGMIALMDAEAREQWYSSLEKEDIPEITAANILNTFEQLHQNKSDVFERGVINVFKGLSWDYQSNSPCKFGKKIIVEGLISYDRWGFHFRYGRRRDQLADLDRMLHLLDGKPVPENCHDLPARLDAHISTQHSSVFEDEYVEICYFTSRRGPGTFFSNAPIWWIR